MNDDPSLFDAVTDGAAAVPDEKPVAPVDTMCLHDFIENPDNPHTISNRAFDRLIEKIKKTPTGLTAKRIAYVYDPTLGKFVVYSGNKRLRVLKKLYGDDYEAPADWFQDISSMSEEQRREFIVTANVNDGRFDVDKLLAQYDRQELSGWVGEDKLAQLIDVVESSQGEPAASESGAASEAVKLVELCIVMSLDDYKFATKRLRAVSDDMAAAFMEVIRGGK